MLVTQVGVSCAALCPTEAVVCANALAIRGSQESKAWSPQASSGPGARASFPSDDDRPRLGLLSRRDGGARVHVLSS